MTVMMNGEILHVCKVMEYLKSTELVGASRVNQEGDSKDRVMNKETSGFLERTKWIVG